MKKEDEVQKLSQEFKRIRQSGGKIIFPSHLKERVSSLLKSGYSIASLCGQLNLCKSQVYSWRSYGEQAPTLPVKPSYEVKAIPVVTSIPKSEILSSPQNKKIRSKMFFRFLSLKITWG